MFVPSLDVKRVGEISITFPISTLSATGRPVGAVRRRMTMCAVLPSSQLNQYDLAPFADSGYIALIRRRVVRSLLGQGRLTPGDM